MFDISQFLLCSFVTSEQAVPYPIDGEKNMS